MSSIGSHYSETRGGGEPPEKPLYEALERWFTAQGYKVASTTGEGMVILPTGPLLGISFLEPDIVAYKKETGGERLVVAEVKRNQMHLLDGIGRCEVFSTVTDFVYLALPKIMADRIGSEALFKAMKVGVLSVEEGNVDVKVKAEQNYLHQYNLRQTLLAMVKARLNIGEG